MIVDGSGNLLTAEVDALVNTVNTVGVMGQGIALQFKRAYPADYAAYRAACRRNEVRPGQMFVFDTGRLGLRRYVINFPTKEHWRSMSQLDDIRAGLADLARVIRDRKIASIAIPALGCGNGGLDWAVVRPIIVEAMNELPDVSVHLYAPSGSPDPQDMPIATPAPRLTQVRAVLLLAIARYQANASAIDVRVGISELEIQKIAYFLQVLGQPLNLSFARGLYGPYAEQLHHVLRSLEGHYLVGYGDRTSKVQDLRPIRLTDGSADDAEQWVRTNDEEAQARIEAFLEAADGYETPYSLELLATVHFAAASQPNADEDALVEIVRGWSGRKARLFTADHVRTAYGRLLRDHVLPHSPSRRT